MTDSERTEFIDMLHRYKERLSTNKEEARKFLIDAGIYNEDGTLTEPYKGLDEVL